MGVGVEGINTTRKTVAGSTQNQQRIVGRGCCFGRVGPVKLQQRVVDRFLLIRLFERCHFFEFVIATSWMHADVSHPLARLTACHPPMLVDFVAECNEPCPLI